MKRTIAIALSSIALAASASAFAQTTIKGPQPSFADYPLVEASIPARADAERKVNRAVPQPSFIDYAVIESDSSTGASAPADEPSTGKTTFAGHRFPQPSFMN
jgi:hypothetical protein